jgi:hypothetical protein
MNEICEIVPSQKGNNKINARGYLMVKEKSRNDIYYWCCERRKLGCKGRVTTILSNDSHYLKSFIDHDHTPQASDANVAKAVFDIKKRASETREKPIQIIQNNMINIPQETRPYMPSRDALRRKIARVRKVETLPEPQSITELNIPNSLCVTLNEEPFLVKDHMVGQERILIFTTEDNIKHLSQAIYWIMDGTFKTVPKIFYQLYSIHAPVGTENNSRILPLVYVLMTGKSEELYQLLFQDLIEFAEENYIQLTPSYIITDFEKAAINASHEEFPGVINKGCFFHLGQNGWRKIQECGLAVQYGNDEHFSLMLRHLFALAFLPAQEIPTVFNILKPRMPPEAIRVIQWFEDNYIYGRIRRHTRNNVIRDPPQFPPALWSVYDSMELGIPRTQNNVEAWHRRWGTLVGESHVGIYTIIKELQKEQQQVEVQVECIIRGEERPKQKKNLIDKEKRIRTILDDREDYSEMDFLRGIAHNLSL